jgi:CheY-like chemotaxis protein
MAKILIIDDDPDIAMATRMALESAGYEVVEARSSKEGLESVVSEKPDLIVLDVMMDTATAGFQTALTLRSPEQDSPYKDYAKIPIIMLTAVHETTTVRFGPDEDYLPVDVFIDKPIDPEPFLEKVAELLAKQKV